MAKNGKFSRKSMKLKFVTMLLAGTLLVGTAIGGTIAWLAAQTDPIANTFTVGDIRITLDESDDLDLNMVPGKELMKDPKVTVAAGSEASYVFVKVEESNVLDRFIEYEVLIGRTNPALESGATYWNVLDETIYPGVYYCKVKAIADDAQSLELPVIGYKDGDTIKENYVLVKDTVTKNDMDELKVTGAVQPALTFTAYAIQSEYLADQNSNSVVDAVDAWLLIDSDGNS